MRLHRHNLNQVNVETSVRLIRGACIKVAHAQTGTVVTLTRVTTVRLFHHYASWKG